MSWVGTNYVFKPLSLNLLYYTIVNKKDFEDLDFDITDETSIKKALSGIKLGGFTVNLVVPELLTYDVLQYKKTMEMEIHRELQCTLYAANGKIENKEGGRFLNSDFMDAYNNIYKLKIDDVTPFVVFVTTLKNELLNIGYTNDAITYTQYSDSIGSYINQFIYLNDEGVLKTLQKNVLKEATSEGLDFLISNANNQKKVYEFLQTYHNLSFIDKQYYEYTQCQSKLYEYKTILRGDISLNNMNKCSMLEFKLYLKFLKYYKGSILSLSGETIVQTPNPSISIDVHSVLYEQQMEDLKNMSVKFTDSFHSIIIKCLSSSYTLEDEEFLKNVLWDGRDLILMTVAGTILIYKLNLQIDFHPAGLWYFLHDPIDSNSGNCLSKLDTIKNTKLRKLLGSIIDTYVTNELSFINLINTIQLSFHAIVDCIQYDADELIDYFLAFKLRTYKLLPDSELKNNCFLNTYNFAKFTLKNRIEDEEVYKFYRILISNESFPV